MARGTLARLRRRSESPRSAADAPMPWHERALLSARAHGRMPYMVDGFVEITEAVRRGHAVLLRRDDAEVADGVRVFAGTSGATGLDSRSDGSSRGSSASKMVTVIRFDPTRARYVLQDAGGAVGSVELTPKRLQRYLDHPDRSVGVALGA